MIAVEVSVVIIILFTFAFLVFPFGQGTSGDVQFLFRWVFQNESRQFVTHIQGETMTTGPKKMKLDVDHKQLMLKIISKNDLFVNEMSKY